MKKEPHVHGSVQFKSNLPIEKVGEIIGREVFSGVKFGGLEKCIYEEVPAIYIDNLMLGFLFVIQGYSGFDKDSGFSLDMTPYFSVKKLDEFSEVEKYDVDLNNYLYALLTVRLKKHTEIQVVKSLSA